MPTRDLLLVDDTALAAPGFVDLARREHDDTASGRFLVLPSPAFARAARGPAGRKALDDLARGLVDARRGRVLVAATRPEARSGIEAAVHGAAARQVGATVLTQDAAWAQELHRTFPALGVGRLDGSVVTPWFSDGLGAVTVRELETAFAPASCAVPSDDATTPERAQPSPRLALGEEHSGSRLGRLIGQGGEGWVFEVLLPGMARPFADLVCKVPRRPSQVRLRKLARMCAVPAIEGVSWPSALVVDAQGEWLGFMMSKASGRSVARVLSDVNDPAASATAFDRLDLAVLAAKVVDRVAAVHAVGALVGDVQPKNVLVVRKRQVTLIDADSFQVEGFACPVGVVDYLHPELLDRNLRTTLRTSAHEAFAVAVLVFNLVMCGWHPYAHKGGATPLENQRKRLFPYRAHRVRAEVPGGEHGVVARLWSHLAPELRAAFEASFEALAPPPVPEWRPMLDRYAKSLRARELSKQVRPQLSRNLWLERPPAR